jgi:hypothetical protein
VGGNPLSYSDPFGLNPVGGATVGAEVGTMVLPGVGTVIGGVIGFGAGVWVGDKLWNNIFSSPPSDSSSDSSRKVPYPERKRGKYTCICRANKDGRSADNCSTDNKDFAMGYGEGSTMNEAKRAAEKDAKEKLGAKSTHHIQCRCTSPKGEPVIPHG